MARTVTTDICAEVVWEALDLYDFVGHLFCSFPDEVDQILYRVMIMALQREPLIKDLCLRFSEESTRDAKDYVLIDVEEHNISLRLLESH